MGIVAGGSERYCTGVFDSICAAVDARMQLWRNAQHKRPQKSGGNENSDRSAHGRTGLHRSGVSDGVQESARLFFGKSRRRFGASFRFIPPQVKRVSKNYIAKQVVFRTIVDVKRRVELKITGDVASKTDGR
jgi:hypothetical protein